MTKYRYSWYLIFIYHQFFSLRVLVMRNCCTVITRLSTRDLQIPENWTICRPLVHLAKKKTRKLWKHPKKLSISKRSSVPMMLVSLIRETERPRKIIYLHIWFFRILAVTINVLKCTMICARFLFILSVDNVSIRNLVPIFKCSISSENILDLVELFRRVNFKFSL